MKARRQSRKALLPSLVLLPAAIGIAFAAAPTAQNGHHAHPLQALATKVEKFIAPAQTAVQKPAQAGLHLAGYTGSLGLDGGFTLRQNLPGTVFGQARQRASRLAVAPRATGDPVILLPYDASNIVRITNAQGSVVRAPRSATDTSIQPNTPLTFTVRVNSDQATTQATSVYIQIKDPDSLYQDTNLTGSPREHKVFTRDPGDIAQGRVVHAANGSGLNIYSDDGSASRVLYNGGFSDYPSSPNVQNFNINEASTTFNINNVNIDFGAPGAVAGYGGNPAAPIPVGTGTTTNNYVGWGQEYECQYLNAHTDVGGYAVGADAANSDYGDPFYLAGYDDQAAGSAGSHPARSEWLKLTPVAGDPELWSATWRSPLSPSDFYVDAIVYDNQNNWRIYDNVWGFSTQPFQSQNDILVVSDNTLGQKFAASALASKGLVNLRPIYYGAESYYTDIDISRLPNATWFWRIPTGATLPSSNVAPLKYSFQNGLGVDSYNDNFLPASVVSRAGQTTTANGATLPKSQAYSLWRILSRGAVPQSVYTAYEPTFVSQPAVSDPQTGFTAPAADGTASPQIPVATRCILWVTPFTNDLPLDVGGTILDASTQTDLRKYVAAGGRLFVSGQDIATAVTLNGVPAFNQSGSFLYDVLNAQFTTNGNGADNQTLAGQAGIGNYLSSDSLFNLQPPPVFDDAYSAFYHFSEPGDVSGYSPPASSDLLALGNNYIGVLGSQTKWRTDGALTQEGPIVHSVGVSQIQSQISQVTPVNGATTNFTAGGSPGMIYKADSAALSSVPAIGSGFGSKVVFSSFGLEGLGQEAYDVIFNGGDNFFAYNNRTNVLHNVVSWLRTGSYQGRIFLGSSANVGVPKATVYLIPFRSVTIPTQPANRQCYSTITSDGTDGNLVGSYHIDGLEPGAYIAVAYKTGYTRASVPTFNFTALPYTVMGDTTATGVFQTGVNLNITPLPPGSINGKVTLNSATGTGVAGATVTFTSSDGTIVSTVTGSDGTYQVTAPVGTYSGIATTTNPAGSSTTVTGIAVSTNQPTTQNFVLTVNPGTIQGLVTYNGSSFAGATVAFTATGATSPIAVATTTAGSPFNFTSPGLPDGTYTITASAPGKLASNTATATVSAGTLATASSTIVLTDATSVTFSGKVTDTTTPTPLPISGATVTIKDLSGNTVTTLTTDASGNFTTSILQGNYTVTASATNYTSQSVSITISANPTVQNFALALVPAKTVFLGGHYNLISLPYDDPSPTAFTDVFGPMFTASGGNRSAGYIYQSTLGNYVAEPTAPADGIHIGRGYFVLLRNNVTLRSIPGTAPTTATVSVPLTLGRDGWNMIGVPSTTPISISRLRIQFASGLTTDFSSAVNKYGVLYPTLYGYDPTTNTYTPLTATAQLRPYQGYWIRIKNQAGLTLLIPTGGG